MAFPNSSSNEPRIQYNAFISIEGSGTTLLDHVLYNSPQEVLAEIANINRADGNTITAYSIIPFTIL